MDRTARPMSEEQADEMIRAIYLNSQSLGLVHDALTLNTQAMDRLTLLMTDRADDLSEAEKEGDTDKWK